MHTQNPSPVPGDRTAPAATLPPAGPVVDAAGPTAPDAPAAAAAQRVLPGEHFARLRAELGGELILPGEAGWDDARRAWQLLVDQHPAAVVVARDAADVGATVRAAAALGLRVAPQATGHGAGTVPALSDTILLRTGALDEVTIDPDARTARVGAGATWGDVLSRAAAHGLTAVGGMAPTVGAVGFLLGGGLGWLARSHGLGANSVVSADIVDARGRSMTIGPDRESELFWAMRGGSAPVIVTAVEIRLYAVPEVVAGSLMWPIERAEEVAHAWRAWAADVPESATSLIRLLRYPPIPEIPEFLRGRSFVAVEVALQMDAEAAGALLEPLRGLAPEQDSVRPMAPDALASVHGDPVDPIPAHGASVTLAEVSEASVSALLGAALAASAAPLLSIELRHLGGALAPGRAGGGAVSAIDGAGLVYAVGIVPVPEALGAVRAAAAELIGALTPHAAAAVVKTFAETPAPASALYGGAVERLRKVALAWDPDRLVSTGHPLG